MDPRVRLLLVLLAVATACGHDRAAIRGADSSISAPIAGRADVGGYSLSYACAGRGSPTVILEAGYTASGLETYGTDVMPAIARTTRVCTYDCAGDGGSDVRPARITPLTAATQARELHSLLDAIHGSPPYVLVGHSYGGMVSREFAALYPAQVVGMVLVDASSEPEIPVYDRLHAGAWVDGSTTPAPNQTIDIHATVRELRRAPPLRSLPLAVITAGILEDRWLRTVPQLEARAQRRLAGLSTNSVHVVDHGVGHFIPERDPNIVVAAVNAVVTAARGGGVLAGCGSIFHTIPSARCLERGQLGHQQT
jgi:pimeloyl-ACP methyl ester carboxylesterase